MTIKIVTDSTADLPKDLAEELGISVIPLNVHFGTELYKDSVDILPDEFYERLVTSARLPTTSQPSVGEFLQLYQDLDKTNDEIVSIHISSKLSGTFNSATQAKEEYKGNCRIEILDSQHGSMGLGIIAIAAARASQRNATIDEVIDEAKSAISMVQFYGLLDTLEYMEKGGRIGKAQAFVGSLLRIKPLLTIKEGEAHPLERARTRSKGIDRLYELAQSHMPLLDLAVVYSTIPDDAKELARRLKHLLPNGDVILSRIGPVVGTHAGPGVLAIALREDRSGKP